MKRHFQISLRAWLILVFGLSLGVWQLTYESAETELSYVALIDVSGRTVTPAKVKLRASDALYSSDPRTFKGKRVGWPMAYSQFGCHDGIRYNGLFDHYNSTNWVAVSVNLIVAVTATTILLAVNAVIERRKSNRVLRDPPAHAG